jgi:hypothetical protein
MGRSARRFRLLPRRVGRPLTAGEVGLGKSVFDDAIDYSRVRVYDCKWRFFMPGHRPHAPNGHIYFPRGTGCYAVDFSRSPLRDRATFIHELAHVWQHQRGVNVAARAALNRSYDYGAVFQGRSFASLGVEAQAKMIADCYLLKNGCVVAGRPSPNEYERLLPFSETPTQAVS